MLRAKEAAIRSRRKILIASVLALVAVSATFVASPAMSRNGGHGGGHGGDTGRGGSDDGENGSGADNGSRRSKAEPTGRGEALSNSRTETRQGRSTGDTVSVRHSNGIAEEVNGRGRYVMRDAKGRTIVNRAATGADVDRLNSFAE